jgi:hypothetical protein
MIWPFEVGNWAIMLDFEGGTMIRTMQKPSEVGTVNLSTTRLVNFILQFLFYYILVQFKQTFISTNNNNKAPQRGVNTMQNRIFLKQNQNFVATKK